MSTGLVVLIMSVLWSLLFIADRITIRRLRKQLEEAYKQSNYWFEKAEHFEGMYKWTSKELWKYHGLDLKQE